MEATYRSALDAGRSLGARISELRALTRLTEICAAYTRTAHGDELQLLLASFDEGLGTRDLIAARDALAAGAHA